MPEDHHSAHGLTATSPTSGFVSRRIESRYTYLVTADDVRVAGELGALLDKEFFAQDLPRFPPNGETASGLLTEAV